MNLTESQRTTAISAVEQWSVHFDDLHARIGNLANNRATPARSEGWQNAGEEGRSTHGRTPQPLAACRFKTTPRKPCGARQEQR